jgi:hypothetical protein
MTAHFPDTISTSARNRKSFGHSAAARTLLFGLVSILMLTLEVFLLVALSSERTNPIVHMFMYLLPIVHALPWLAGIQCLRKAKRAFRDELINRDAASLCYSVIIALLAAAYVVLGTCEIALGFVLRLRTGP